LLWNKNPFVKTSPLVNGSAQIHAYVILPNFLFGFLNGISFPAEKPVE
jgi:hypothetical protein